MGVYDIFANNNGINADGFKDYADYVGYPSGKGEVIAAKALYTIAITDSCEDPEAAFDFIELGL